MAENEILKNMVMNFRVSELTMLLNFAGRSRTGRKTELQVRALELIKLRASPINTKVDIYLFNSPSLDNSFLR